MANTKKITIDISPSLHKRITRAAKREETSMSEWVRNIFYEKTKRKPRQAK